MSRHQSPDNALQMLSVLLASEASLLITHCRLTPYKIKLRSPWLSAAAKLHFRQGILVELTSYNLSATGECAPLVDIGTESLSTAHRVLREIIPVLINTPLNINTLAELDEFPASRFALETALLSLLAQRKNLSLSQLLAQQYQLKINKKILLNAMLGPVNPHLPVRAKQAEIDGYQCLKIKMGLTDIYTEAEQIKKLLTQLQAETLIRLDANKSWSYKETQWLLNYLAGHYQQIDYIEEPLKQYTSQNYLSLQADSPVSLALDESFTTQCNLSLIDYPLHTLVLKPMAQGGIINSLYLFQQAQQLNIRTIITSSIETAHGLWPLTHLCAVINNQQFHGLSTSTWLESTLIKPPEIHHGSIYL